MKERKNKSALFAGDLIVYREKSQGIYQKRKTNTKQTKKAQQPREQQNSRINK